MSNSSLNDEWPSVSADSVYAAWMRHIITSDGVTVNHEIMVGKIDGSSQSNIGADETAVDDYPADSRTWA